MSRFQKNESGTGQSCQGRSVRWPNSGALVRNVIQISGIEFLQAIVNDELPQPPIAYLLRSRITGAAPGYVTFTWDPDESMNNPVGTIHAGVVATLLDAVLGCAVQSTLAAGYSYTSIDTHVQFLRTVYAGSGPLTAVGTVTRDGSRVAFAEGQVTDAQGAIVATGYGSILINAPWSTETLRPKGSDVRRGG